MGVVVLSGCGAATSATGSTPTPADGPGSVSTSAGHVAGAPSLDRPSVDPTGPTFPLTIRRTGGIADYRDTVVLRGNGTLTVDTKQIHQRTCTLDKATRNSLLAALTTLRLGGTASGAATDPVPTGTSSNPITLTVIDVHNRPIDLSDPFLGEIHGRLAALVADVTLSSPAQTSCATTTQTPAG